MHTQIRSSKELYVHISTYVHTYYDLYECTYVCMYTPKPSPTQDSCGQQSQHIGAPANIIIVTQNICKTNHYHHLQPNPQFQWAKHLPTSPNSYAYVQCVMKHQSTPNAIPRIQWHVSCFEAEKHQWDRYAVNVSTQESNALYKQNCKTGHNLHNLQLSCPYPPLHGTNDLSPHQERE